MECGICYERNPELLQEHHWSYNPEIKSVLCIFCHSAQHNHGVGRGKFNRKDKLVIFSFIIKKQKEISSKDLYRFYGSQTFKRLKLFEQLGFLKRKRFTELPKIYEINPLKIKLEQKEK